MLVKMKRYRFEATRAVIKFAFVGLGILALTLVTIVFAGIFALSVYVSSSTLTFKIHPF